VSTRPRVALPCSALPKFRKTSKVRHSVSATASPDAPLPKPSLDTWPARVFAPLQDILPFCSLQSIVALLFHFALCRLATCTSRLHPPNKDASNVGSPSRPQGARPPGRLRGCQHPDEKEETSKRPDFSVSLLIGPGKRFRRCPQSSTVASPRQTPTVGRLGRDGRQQVGRPGIRNDRSLCSRR
jgi:hypothetical protein